RLHNKEIKLYYERRTLIDKKPRHYVLNAIANKLLRIIFTLVEKGEYYDANFGKFSIEVQKSEGVSGLIIYT
ncbi:MAG: hypothetical protein U0L77_02805, partial [Prevotellamassilia sp.]|nr:hypothetical protein [Prevotellamassilia sp.]